MRLGGHQHLEASNVARGSRPAQHGVTPCTRQEPHATPASAWRILPALLLAALLLVAGGCRRDMRDQPRLNPLTASKFFADGSASRPLLTNTVAYGHLRTDTPWFTGMTNGQFISELPPEVTLDMALLQRGQERFGIFCTPCHDRAGSGLGMIVRRGYKQPRSYHDPALRSMPPGYFFNVISHGFATMPDYSAQVPVADRWAIVAYIRALQLSQQASTNLLTTEDLALLDSPGGPASAPAAPSSADVSHGGPASAPAAPSSADVSHGGPASAPAAPSSADVSHGGPASAPAAHPNADPTASNHGH